MILSFLCAKVRERPFESGFVINVELNRVGAKSGDEACWGENGICGRWLEQPLRLLLISNVVHSYKKQVEPS